jgi:hypothetical protein
MVQIDADSVIHWELWLDGAKVSEGDTDAFDRNNDPDQPDLPVNGSVWYAVPTKSSGLSAVLKVQGVSAQVTVRAGSRAVLS